jgi:hypothetical protein
MIRPSLSPDQIENLGKLCSENNGAEVVFGPTPLDILGLAQLRRDEPELALELAAQSGRDHDAANHRRSA